MMSDVLLVENLLERKTELLYIEINTYNKQVNISKTEELEQDQWIASLSTSWMWFIP